MKVMLMVVNASLGSQPYTYGIRSARHAQSLGCIMELAALWKAVCIVWQQGPVHQAVESLQQASVAGVSEEVQDAFSVAMATYASFQRLAC